MAMTHTKGIESFRKSRPEKCEYCGDTKALMEVHHIVRRIHGGTNAHSNLCMLCESCHTQLHSREALRKKTLRMLKELLAMPNIELTILNERSNREGLS